METDPQMVTNAADPKSDRSLSEMMDMLGHSQRRRILATLAAANPRDEDEFTAADTGDNGDDLGVIDQELYQRHLPKLDDADFIDWDRETNTITRGPRFDEIAPLIRLMKDHQDELPDGWL